MANCRKCNAKIPNGKELCEECEQVNNESYLDSLLHTVASEEQIAQDAKNARKLSIERMREKIDPSRMEELEKEEVHREEMAEHEEFSLPDIPLPPEILTSQENEDVAENLLPEDAKETDMAENFDFEIPNDFLSENVESTDNVLDNFSLPDPESITEIGNTEPDSMFSADNIQAEEELSTEEISPFPESTDMFSHIENTEDSINNISTPENEIQGGKEKGMAEKNEEENLKFDDGGETQEDILDLINSIYNSEEGESFSETDNIADSENFGTENNLEMDEHPDDMTDFFSDVLSEEELPSVEEINMIAEEETKGEDSEEKKKKKEKKEDKKPGIFKRIFGNVRPERTEEEIAQMKEKVIADAEAKEVAEEEKKKKEAEAKEAKKKKAADDKAAADKKKQENAKKKAEAAKAKKEAKQQAKDKKKQEVQNLIDAIDENEGRINRIGASIVFVFFAAVAIAIIIGTKVYAYSQNIENAQKSFEYKHYNEAYEEIAGIDAKEEDEAFVLKVMVVMYTHKQLNSYQHYYAIGLYPEALDSLLKGLDRYDKYSALASVIDVSKDMDSLREEILEQLKTVYSLTEREAMELVAMEDHAAYTEKVYEIARKIVRDQEEKDTSEKNES